MKIHIGCGTVYLRGWLNIELPGARTFLASERPDLIETLIADESDYYARHRDKTIEIFRDGPLDQDIVCDAFGSFQFIPARDGSVDEILSRQCFEHLDRQEALVAIRSCHQVLQSGGVLRIDIPDADETIRRYRETGDEFYVRHLFGPRRDVYGCHTHYTKDMLKELIDSRGFTFIAEEENLHFYPAFTLRFKRT